jgi:phage terminase small subunit
MAKMTAKQQRFCDEYLISLNATQAAIKAGYSKKTAGVIGDENLKKPYIREYIDKRMAEKEAELIADQNEVIKYLTSVMRREATESVVVTLSEEETKYVEDEHGTMRKQTIKKEVPKVVEIPAKLSDANKAAELLGKRYGLYVEQQERAARLEKLKAETARIKGESPDDEKADDGFLEALQSEAESVWQEQ